MGQYCYSVWQMAVILTAHFSVCDGLFTADFASYVEKNFGKSTLSLLERRDIGEYDTVSFGGKRHRKESLSHRPVILVHGIVGDAGDFAEHRSYFIDHGYSSSEIYATTYGSPTEVDAWNSTLSCPFFRQMHELIAAVAGYTGSTVDVIAYSAGSLIARKAILGGKCADNGQDIGSNLTSRVTTFVSVGGANHGIEHCLPYRGLCNQISSLHCASKLVRELNAQKRRYEGERTFALYSVDDETIGRNCCGVECARLEHATDSFVVHEMDHSALLTSTLSWQFQLVSSSPREAKSKGIGRRLPKSVNYSNEVPNETTTTSPELNRTYVTSPKSYRTLEKSNFDPTFMLCFVFIALGFFLFKFLSRCVCDKK